MPRPRRPLAALFGARCVRVRRRRGCRWRRSLTCTGAGRDTLGASPDAARTHVRGGAASHPCTSACASIPHLARRHEACPFFPTPYFRYLFHSQDATDRVAAITMHSRGRRRNFDEFAQGNLDAAPEATQDDNLPDPLVTWSLLKFAQGALNATDVRECVRNSCRRAR